MIQKLLKYIVGSLAIVIAAVVIPQRKLNLQEIINLTLSGTAVYLVIDLFAPRISASLRHGTGFGIGSKLIGYPSPKSEIPAAEGFAPIQYDHRWHDEYMRPHTDLEPENICFNRPPTHVKWPLYGMNDPNRF